MNISTRYMGLELKNPIIVSSSRLTGSYDKIVECAKNGAAAIVLKSLFEEQIISDIDAKLQDNEMYFWYPEATKFVKGISKDHGVNEYIKLIKKVKDNVDIPVIASINCNTSQEWPAFASELEKAGADAIELNIAIFPFDENVESKDIENLYIEILKEVKLHVSIPVSIKLGSCFTNISRIVTLLDVAGADGLVLFNRFFRPDIDIEKGKLIFDNYLSEPSEMTQSLRWVGLMASKVKCDIVASTGIHDYQGVVKQIMAGATATTVCSVLYKKGIPYIKEMLSDLENWMQTNNIKSLDGIRGKINLGKDNSAEFERVQFMRKTTGIFN
ncbi:MAG: dihydroorotate dehydrogenase-like protein [Bacteroidales bacterium]|nr:dihydroorotate dehydrogenase-like protein [Bacteroidales bacterium]